MPQQGVISSVGELATVFAILLQRHTVAIVFTLQRHTVAIVFTLQRHTVVIVFTLQRHTVTIVFTLQRHTVAIVFAIPPHCSEAKKLFPEKRVVTFLFQISNKFLKHIRSNTVH